MSWPQAFHDAAIAVCVAAAFISFFYFMSRSAK